MIEISTAPSDAKATSPDPSSDTLPPPAFSAWPSRSPEPVVEKSTRSAVPASAMLPDPVIWAERSATATVPSLMSPEPVRSRDSFCPRAGNVLTAH